MQLLSVMFLGKDWEKVLYPELSVSKLSFEIMIHRIVTPKYEKLEFHAWMKRLLYPWIKFSFLKIIHGWKNLIFGWKWHPWKKVWMIFLSVESMDEKYRWRKRMTHIDTAYIASFFQNGEIECHCNDKDGCNSDFGPTVDFTASQFYRG